MHCPVTGDFDQATEQAVQKFQTDRSIDTDGIVGVHTWSLLVEAGVRLGERVLYLRSPNIRGDDVADLQQMLSRLGFFAGRIDGIWGPESASALVDFQLNVGIVGDGACGARTIVALERVMRPLADAKTVAQLRELHRLPISDANSGLLGQRVAVGEIGGLGTMLSAARRTLMADGADVLPLNHPSWSAQAVQANRFNAAVYVAVEVRPAPASISYFQGRHFTSELGRQLSQDLSEQLKPVLGHLEECGMALPVLRESKMPAVLIRVSDAAVLLANAQEIAAAICTSITYLLSNSQDQQ